MERNTDPQNLESRLRADDKSALEQVYKLYREEFLNYVKRYKIDDAQAMDIYQDTIIAMHQNFVTKQLQLQQSSLKTYLFGIGKNKVFRYLKLSDRHLRWEADFEDQELESPEEPGLSPQQKLLARKLNQISERCREVLLLFYFRNLTISEIVEQTHYKDVNTVKSHKSRCMKNLKTLMGVDQ
ncbi:sigma-70 family RNA polymerase sigma factor [Gilvibacter sp.]|uniref:RNA polymerase sigma factor n=1 Tax=Gilvibacter sp. TaxID=2729997 RepID=UPI0025C1E739|nr:sigma-70 family RNA polymerase sigma factor [Gilvibacter sp.]NQX76191.1 sigma-70 family RNA polymerase sigma factor [Gilvibacter sp.]